MSKNKQNDRRDFLAKMAKMSGLGISLFFSSVPKKSFSSMNEVAATDECSLKCNIDCSCYCGYCGCGCDGNCDDCEFCTCGCNTCECIDYWMPSQTSRSDLGTKTSNNLNVNNDVAANQFGDDAISASLDSMNTSKVSSLDNSNSTNVNYSFTNVYGPWYT